MATKECKQGTVFPGVIGRTAEESTPAWPQPMRAVPGTPNVLSSRSTTPDSVNSAVTAAR